MNNQAANPRGHAKDVLSSYLAEYESGARTRMDFLEAISQIMAPDPVRHVALVEGEKVWLTDAESAELQRHADLAAYSEGSGEAPSDVERRFGLGSYGMHELIDRLHVQLSTWSDHIADHPACLLLPDVYFDADRIGAAMADLYQKVAILDDNFTEGKAKGCPVTGLTISDHPSTSTTPPGLS